MTKEGDLVSVFKNPNSKEDIMPLLSEAASHATTLDCFDSGNGYLPNLYAKLGFKPVAKVEFNPEHAPTGWNYDTMDNPNVVFMAKQGVDMPEGYAKAKGSIPTVDYDKAVEIQHGKSIGDDTKRLDRYSKGQVVKVKGSSDGKFSGFTDAVIVNPHSNAQDVDWSRKDNKPEKGRLYDKHGHSHIPTATVEYDRSKRGLPPLRFEAYHHQIEK